MEASLFRRSVSIFGPGLNRPLLRQRTLDPVALLLEQVSGQRYTKTPLLKERDAINLVCHRNTTAIEALLLTPAIAFVTTYLFYERNSNRLPVFI